MRYLSTFLTAIVVLGIFFLQGCVAGSRITEQEKDSNFSELREWIDSKQYTVVSDWANPVGGGQVNLYGNTFNLGSFVNFPGGAGRINLIGNPNEVSINKDSVRIYLPYFGEVQVLKNYGGRGGIDFEGTYSDYEVKQKDENRELEISFDIQDESENLEVIIQLFSNKQSRIILNSAYRNSITYDGKIRKLQDAVESDKDDPNDYFIHN